MTDLELLNYWLEVNRDVVPNAQEIYDAFLEALS